MPLTTRVFCVTHRANPGGAGMGERQAASRAAGGPGVGPCVGDCPVAMRLCAGVLTPLGRNATTHRAGVGMLTIASPLPRQPSKRRRTEKRFFFSSVFGATYVQDATSHPLPAHTLSRHALMNCGRSEWACHAALCMPLPAGQRKPTSSEAPRPTPWRMCCAG